MSHNIWSSYKKPDQERRALSDKERMLFGATMREDVGMLTRLVEDQGVSIHSKNLQARQ